MRHSACHCRTDTGAALIWSKLAASPARRPLTLYIGCALLALLGWGLIAWWRDAHAFHRYLEALRAQPGIVITDSDRNHGHWQISVLRDPVAIDPQTLLLQWKVDPKRVDEHWQPYTGLNPPLVLKRMTAALGSPAGIAFTIDVVASSDRARHRWDGCTVRVPMLQACRTAPHESI
jgi:hypothetical protein